MESSCEQDANFSKPILQFQLNHNNWARLSDVRGEISSIIANDNAIGQYYVQVTPSDFALETACDLELGQ
jgi:hypothetical protein